MKIPPISGAAIRFMTSEPVPTAHMIGMRPRNVVATVMNLGRSRWTAPSRMACLQLGQAAEAPLPLRLLVGQVQVQEHEDPGLGVHPQQGDQADPDPDAHVVAEQVEEPDGADRGERHGQGDDAGLRHRPGVQVEQEEDEEQRQGDDHLQPRLDPLHGLVLAAPGDGVARQELHLVPQQPIGLLDVALRVAPRQVHVDVAR